MPGKNVAEVWDGGPRADQTRVKIMAIADRVK
jgi:hypothetical protein